MVNVSLFTKEELLKGYMNGYTASTQLKCTYFASIAYCGLNTTYEDLLCDLECFYFDDNENMVDYNDLEGALEAERHELTL